MIDPRCHCCWAAGSNTSAPTLQSKACEKGGNYYLLREATIIVLGRGYMMLSFRDTVEKLTPRTRKRANESTNPRTQPLTHEPTNPRTSHEPPTNPRTPHGSTNPRTAPTNPRIHEPTAPPPTPNPATNPGRAQAMTPYTRPARNPSKST